MIVAQDKRRAPFTRDEFAALWASDMPTREIALRAGRSTTNVQDWAKRFGLPRRPTSASQTCQPLTISESEFVTLWESGLTVPEISARIGMSRAGIERTVKRLGLARRCVSHDERLPSIRDEFEALWFDRNVSTRFMARRFGVHKNTVGDWAKAFGLPPKPLPFASGEYEEGPLPGDPSPKEIAERAAECRARRELAKAQAEW